MIVFLLFVLSMVFHLMHPMVCFKCGYLPAILICANI